MFIKRVFPLGIIILAGVIGLWNYHNTCAEPIDHTYQNGWKGENPFDVKVERTSERCVFAAVVAGANYVFSSRQGKSENWHKIMTFRHDDPINISSENIHIVNDRVAYVFIGWKAAVTSDAGKTWNLWNAEKDIVNWKGANYGMIEKMNMSEDGEGVMVLNPIPDRNEPQILITSDFGKNWNQTK